MMVLIIGIVYLLIGLFILFEAKADKFFEDKHEFIETAYLWGLVIYYIFILCLFFGD